MEEAAMTVIEYMAPLIRLILLIAVAVGIITLPVGIFFRGKTGDSRTLVIEHRQGRLGQIVERLAVFLCAPISLIGLVIAVQTVRLHSATDPAYQPLSVILLVATILMGLPALLWKTRLRLAAEATATISVAVVSVLTGFSIGFFFVPLTALMIAVCVQHLREVDNTVRRGRARRVDSLT